MPPLDQRDHLPTASLHDRLQNIHQRIRASLDRAGRRDRDVRLVAVTKTVSAERMNQAFADGVADFGESKVQEAFAKWPALERVVNGRPATAHFIGRLQTNKARKAMELFDVIQSVDRPRLAEALNRIAAETGKRQRCLIEVKTSDEPSKSGVPLAEAGAFVKDFDRYDALALEGVMTIAPYGPAEKNARAAFRALKRFFEEHRAHFGERPVLSMGMSDDFEIAIEEGSTMVRVGRAIFGERD